MNHVDFQTLIIGLLESFFNSNEEIALALQDQCRICVMRKTIYEHLPFVQVKVLFYSQTNKIKSLDLSFEKKNDDITNFWVAEKQFGKIHLRIVYNYNEQFRKFVVEIISVDGKNTYIREL